MTRTLLASPVALALAMGLAAPAAAQSGEDISALRAELAAMREKMAQLEQQVTQLESDLASADAKAVSANEAAAKAGEQAVAAAANKPSVEWKGAPKIAGKGGWSFKPRGRIQVDAGTVDAPSAISDDGLGFANEIRRARLGVEGDIPGGFGYKFELDFADNSAEVTDAILTYADGGLEIAVGQHNGFQSLEELTSSRFTSFMERAAFTDAFGFERRLGVSAEYGAGDVLVQGGLFTDNIEDLGDENNSWGGDARLVFMPKLGDAQLHLGGSVHWRDFNDAQGSVRYRQRPQVHFTDTRFVNTGNIAAEGEFGWGLEGAVISGPFHAAAEGFWQRADAIAMASDPTFFGGYAEAGIFLTKGDSRGYKGGKFDRVKPENPVGEGGFGAVQLVGRVDFLDLNDAGIIGGKQTSYGLSLIWTPTDYTRFMLNYIRNDYEDAAIAAGADRNYGVDAFGVRAQVDF